VIVIGILAPARPGHGGARGPHGLGGSRVAGGSGGAGDLGAAGGLAGAEGRAGLLEAIARRAAGTGARTEIVGVAPVGTVGDRQLAALAAAGVGHATVIRSEAAGIEAADLDLALRYLPEVRVIVLASPAAPLLETAVAASSWSGAPLILIGPLDPDATRLAEAAEPAPVVLAPPADDPDAAFAGVVATLAARLDAGEDPVRAWKSTIASLAIEPA
jgi:hypothetical protein